MCLIPLFACLLLSPLLARQEAPKDTPLWTNQEFGSGEVLVVTPDGKELFTAHQLVGLEAKHHPVICRWNLSTGKLLHHYEIADVGQKIFANSQMLQYVVEVSATPDAKTLLVSWETSRQRGVYSRHRLLRLDLRSGERHGESIDDLSWHPPGVFAQQSHCAISPDGRWFYAFRNGAMEQLDVYSVETGKIVLSLPIEKELQATSVAYSQNGAQAAVLFHQTRGGQNTIRLFCLPDGRIDKEFLLPSGKLWTAVHSDRGGRLLAEASEEDALSKQAAEAEANKVGSGSVPRPIRATRRSIYSFDLTAQGTPLTMQSEPLLHGFHGQSLNLPSLSWDAGPTWVAYFSEGWSQQNVIPAGLHEQKLSSWRDIKVVDRKTGHPLYERKQTPYSCFVSPDGRYLVACDPMPDTKAGVFVWRLPSK
jgi:WD40 repeat protein